MSESIQENQAEGCLFCAREDQTLNRVLRENELFYTRFDNFPSRPGHVELVPKRHVESFFDLTQPEVLAFYALMAETRTALLDAYAPDGFTIGVNEGKAAGRGVHHLHVHLIPRHIGDLPDPRGGIRRALPNGDPDLWRAE